MLILLILFGNSDNFSQIIEKIEDIYYGQDGGVCETELMVSISTGLLYHCYVSTKSFSSFRDCLNLTVS